MTIIWNGKRLDWFKPSKGIRQGDSISPYLFVLYLKRIGHIIQDVVENGRWKPICLPQNDLGLSHLFFANDLILFPNVFVDQMKTVMECLEVFCDLSGQKVNLQK